MEINFLKKIRYSTLFIIILGILVFVNLISVRHFLRFDLTDENEYTLSDSTKKILGSLDDVVNIKVYFSEKLPPNLIPLSQYVHDLMSEYFSYSKGNIQVDYIDPLSDPALSEEVSQLGIPQIQMNILEKDKVQLQNGYLGIAIFYVDKHEVLPFVQDTENLEYELSSAIKKVTNPVEKVLGFLKGHLEYEIYGESAEYSTFGEALGKNYEIKEIDISQQKAISGVDTLIVAGPSSPAFSDTDISAIEQFMKGGGNVIFLLETFGVGGGLQTTATDLGVLKSFLESLGVSVKNGFVLDEVNEMASFSQGFVRFFVPYPFWVKIVDFSKTQPIVSKLDSLVFPWASPLSVSQKEMVNFEILAKSSSHSFLQESPNLDPNQNFSLPESASTQDMVVLGSQRFSASTVSGTDDSSNATTGDNSNVTGDTVSRFAVIGDADFLKNNFLNQFPQNLDFGLNLVDYLTLDESLIGIRSRGASDRPLLISSENPERTKLIARIIGILGMPLLIVLYGIIRGYLRRRDQQNFEF